MSFSRGPVLWHGADLTQELHISSHCKDSLCGLRSVAFNILKQACENTTQLSALCLEGSKASSVITFTNQKNPT